MRNPFEEIDQRLSRIETMISELKPVSSPSPSEQAEKLLTQAEAAKELRCSKVTLIKLVKSGYITSHRLGSNIRYKYSDIQAALKERKFSK